MSSTKWDMVPVLDISAGGLSFNYTKNLGIYSLLDFKIGISTLTPAINCVAKIIRIEEPRPLPHTYYIKKFHTLNPKKSKRNWSRADRLLL